MESHATSEEEVVRARATDAAPQEPTDTTNPLAVDGVSANDDSSDTDIDDPVPTDAAAPPVDIACGDWTDAPPLEPGLADPLLPLGIGSGGIRSQSAVIWTRTDGPSAVRVRYSAGPLCEEMVSHEVLTTADGGYTAEISLKSLNPDTLYRYRVAVGSDVHLSSPGWFLTAPEEDVPVRLAFSGDVSNQTAYYELLPELVTTGAALFLSLGDWPYSDASPAAHTLQEYRQKHAEIRMHSEVKDLMTYLPVHGVWDDHEIMNDWDGHDTNAESDRVTAGVQAWHEFFVTEDAPGGEAYRSHRWGPGLELFYLDTRRHRSDNAADDDQSKTMLGQSQLTWLLDGLAQSTADFKLILSSVPLDHGTTGNDHWAGFTSERAQILNHVMTMNIGGVVFLTADQHWLAVHHFPSGVKEWQTGPLAQYVRTPAEGMPPWVLLQVPVRNYGLLDYAPGSPSSLRFTAWNEVGELLFEESIESGRGTITVSPQSPQQSWSVVGAHTYAGVGFSVLKNAPPGKYTISWVSTSPEQEPPPEATSQLADGEHIYFSLTGAEQSQPLSFEGFDAGAIPNDWVVVDQGIDDPSSNWHVVNGVATETGNCYDVDSTEDTIPMLGTFLWNQEASVADARISINVFANDNDAFGLMYGVQDSTNYFRVSMDHQRSYARLVRVDDGVFTTLAEDLDFTPPMSQWGNISITRQADTHRVMWNGTTLFETQDAHYPEGAIALYAYGMSDVRFDNVAVFPLAP